jgi:peptidoglycan/LPS O-acetylase OafA/YrhL
MSTQTIESARENSYDILRAIFALFVVAHHSVVLSGETYKLYQNIGYNLAYIGLRGFFVLSGYLIFQSALRSSSLRSFWTKRCLRLFPGLLVVLVLTVIACSFVYQGSMTDYWTSSAVWNYIPNNISLYHLQYSLPGVFEENAWGTAINGSLWTLAFEFSLYIIFSVFLFIRHPKVVLGLLFTALFALLYLHGNYTDELYGRVHFGLLTWSAIEFSLFFVLGALISLTNIVTRPEKGLVLALCALWLGYSIYQTDIGDISNYLPLALLVVIGGSYYSHTLGNFMKRFGDTSYGIYIYSFPIQQLLVYALAPNTEVLLALSVPLSILFGYASWHLVEKRFLRTKKRAVSA